MYMHLCFFPGKEKETETLNPKYRWAHEVKISWEEYKHMRSLLFFSYLLSIISSPECMVT